MTGIFTQGRTKSIKLPHFFVRASKFNIFSERAIVPRDKPHQICYCCIYRMFSYSTYVKSTTASFMIKGLKKNTKLLAADCVWGLEAPTTPLPVSLRAEQTSATTTTVIWTHATLDASLRFGFCHFFTLSTRHEYCVLQHEITQYHRSSM